MTILLCERRERGLTLMDVCMIIVVITFAAIVYLSFTDRNVRARAFHVQCINNLKQTARALDVWANDHGEKFPMEISQTNGGTMEFTTGANEWRHFQVMSNELVTPMMLFCPSETSRMRAINFNFFNNSNISFFINLDFSRPNPSAIWSGDRNIATDEPIRDGILELTTNQPVTWTTDMHRRVGNLLLFDGSVQQVNSAGLDHAVANSGAVTNRWQMPVLAP